MRLQRVQRLEEYRNEFWLGLDFQQIDLNDQLLHMNLTLRLDEQSHELCGRQLHFDWDSTRLLLEEGILHYP